MPTSHAEESTQTTNSQQTIEADTKQMERNSSCLLAIKTNYPDKFKEISEVFKHIKKGSHIFIGTGASQPQFVLQELNDYAERHPKDIADAELFQIWSMAASPYAEQNTKKNQSIFTSKKIHSTVHLGIADYTPMFLSRIPDLIHKGVISIDVAILQVSCPDEHGYMSLGVSVDICKAIAEKAAVVIVQSNSQMPRVHGGGFLHANDVDFIIPHDEPILEYHSKPQDEVSNSIGAFIARLINDGDTLQVGYGDLPNAALYALDNKKNLGIHTEMLSDGVVYLMKKGVVNNSKKSVNRHVSVASYCLGSQETYRYIHDNLAVEFRTIDYTNNPLLIARQDNMTAINSALEIDLTGQASGQPIGNSSFSNTGGTSDFMRGATLAKNGKTILVISSLSTVEQDHKEQDGKPQERSSIVPFISEGASVTLNRADVQYVVTEYGIAYLYGKNIRNRTLQLINIAHPKFRPWLLEEAKRLGYVYQDTVCDMQEGNLYPDELETLKTTSKGLQVFIRPIKLSDEQALKDFFYSLSEDTMYKRFMSFRNDMTHERLKPFMTIDYLHTMILLVFTNKQVHNQAENLIAMGEYNLNEKTNLAEAAFTVKDEYQRQGIGTTLIEYLTVIAKSNGISGFTAEVLSHNKGMLNVFRKMNFSTEQHISDGVYELTMKF